MAEVIYPTTEAEITANRARFIEALINEDPNAQCQGNLFAGYEMTDAEGKEKRCALGVAARLFFGIETYSDAETYDREAYDAADGHGLHVDIATMLGIEDVRPIWRANDTAELSFAEVGHMLESDWDV